MKGLRTFLPVLFLVFGILLCSYPWISNYLYEKSAGSKIQSYQKKVENLAENRKAEWLSLAQKYNQELSGSRVKLTDPFSEIQASSGLSYQKMLAMDSSGIMGTVEIPCIRLELPIYHGTSQAVLEKGAGHLFGTSLPVGGKSTHSVITGHTGLGKARLFTDLTELKKGDLFYISVLSKNLAYRVDQISVIKPEDTEKLQIVEGRDQVTLMTCTPYGINSHRLLVRGSRTKYQKAEKERILGRNQNSQWMRAYQKEWIIGLLILVVLWAIRSIYQKIKRKRERRHQ